MPALTITYNDQRPLLCFIVDDNAINLLLLKKMLLKTLFCDVSSSDTALALIDKVHTRDISRRAIVLTDVHMPQMDGFELALELRAHWDAAALPILGAFFPFVV